MAIDPKQIVDGLVQRGVPRAAAIGFAGNAAVESQFDPGINEINPTVAGSRGGFGLWQHTGPRRRQLENFAASNGLDVADPETQMDFVAWELENTESRAARRIYDAETPEQAAQIISESFLRPGIPHLDRRLSATRQIAQAETGTMTDAAPEISPGLMSAYESGQLTPDQADVVRRVLERSQAATPAQANELSPGLRDAFLQGTEGPLTASQLRDVQRLITSGAISNPAQTDINLPPAAIPGVEADMGQGTAPQPFFDIAESVSREPRETAAAALSGAMGSGPSLVGGMIPDQIDIYNQGGPSIPIPEGVRNVAGRIGDAGLALASGAEALYTGAIGGAADVAEAVGVPNPRGLARDLIALPEAFAGSPVRIPSPQRIAPSRAASAPDVAASPAQPPQPSAEQIGALIRTAAGRGPGTSAARRELADVARLNPNAIEAADRLGIDLPADVFSDSQIVREAAGLTRSVAGTEASTAWRQAVVGAIEKADEAIAGIEGTPDIAGVSDRVLSTLRGTQAALKEQASDIYNQIEAAMPDGSVISVPNLQQALGDIERSLGGLDGMTGPERRLYEIASSGKPITYRRLIRERQDIGRAIGSGQGPYGDVNTFDLRRLYSALSDDQMLNVESSGGPDLRANLELANSLTAQRKDLERSIVGAFGQDFGGSIARQLQGAITSGARGDVAGMNRVMQVIPQELRREAMATAITAATRSRRATEPGFGFAEFTKTYAGLRENPAIFSQVSKTLGPEGTQVLNDIYQVSRRVTDARANVIQTGKANQALVSPMVADNLLEQVLASSAGRGVVQGIASGGGAVGGGPVGAIAGGALASALARARPDRLARAGDLFRSEQFKKLAETAAAGGDTARGQAAVLRTPAFRNWAQSARIKAPDAWLASVLTSTTVDQNESALRNDE